ncbi:pimeloyl-ACP methyl ester carboxylesterase [Microbacterium sp. AG1240]|uniref:alpha/beta fold hydrolase n=1 Tax=Microbacterium sp. AG1240 TaxID=2183992 RepID=UPI000EAF1A6B|nr:alpha/beta fold hydrolase [Microbacterium sp. AG1240]RKT33289.1 pimeloyl-ACP methyl ester carboxylesterase [Microbacterium sp. AG1240]
MDATVTHVDGLVVHEVPGDGGAVLLWHHGSPQTGAVLPPVLDAARARGWGVVSIARPGYGGSSRALGRTCADVATGVARVLAVRGAERVVSVGASGGGPHALACAAAMPERVVAVVAFASPAPFVADDGWFEGMRAPGALRAATQGEGARAHFAETDEFDPAQFVAADFAALEGPWGSMGRDAGMAERDGPWGLIDDDLAFTRPWGFALSDIAVPALIYQGDADRVIPPHHARSIAAAVPGADLREVAGAGHVSILERLPEALERVARSIPRP